MTHQGSMITDPCDGTGLLVVDVGHGTVAARCLCEKGQLQMSAHIPLVSAVAGITTEQLQDFYPDGIPDVIPRGQVTMTPVGPKRRARHKVRADEYRHSKARASGGGC